MEDVERRRRAGRAVMQGRARSRAVAGRLGTGLREARVAIRMTQQELSDLTGVSQPQISALERGQGGTTPIETWAVLAAAVDEQFVGFLERAPGADRPRDMEHLKRQQLVIERAAAGGWTAMPEEPLDRHRDRSRSVDVLLQRHASREAVVNEIWNGFTDVGEAMRSLDGKVATVERCLNGALDLAAPRWRVSGLWIVRGTRRNHALASELSTLLSSKFPSSSRLWLRALSDPTMTMPTGFGFIWTNVPGTRLYASRVGTRNVRSH